MKGFLGFTALTAALCMLAGCPNDSGDNPPLTGSVRIQGRAEVGETLIADTKSLNGSGTLKYKWCRYEWNNGQGSLYPVGDEKTYTPLNAGDIMVLKVQRDGYSGEITSDAVSIAGAEEDSFIPVKYLAGVYASEPSGTSSPYSIALNATVIPENATNTNIIWTFLDGQTNQGNASILGKTLTASSYETYLVRATIEKGLKDDPPKDFTQDYAFTISAPSNGEHSVTVEITEIPNVGNSPTTDIAALWFKESNGSAFTESDAAVDVPTTPINCNFYVELKRDTNGDDQVDNSNADPYAGLTGYQWYIDGVRQSSTVGWLNVTVAELTNGDHWVMFTAVKESDGLTYSQTAAFKIQK
ncbi:MAG: hypothetical protein LBG87_02655 [Spirochaetaceae bacterium]|jgi:hypothetical protein|nr:hypothetical protein [Spirochaetaceae bacterium]